MMCAKVSSLSVCGGAWCILLLCASERDHPLQWCSGPCFTLLSEWTHISLFATLSFSRIRFILVRALSVLLLFSWDCDGRRLNFGIIKVILQRERTWEMRLLLFPPCHLTSWSMPHHIFLLNFLGRQQKMRSKMGTTRFGSWDLGSMGPGKGDLVSQQWSQEFSRVQLTCHERHDKSNHNGGQHTEAREPMEGHPEERHQRMLPAMVWSGILWYSWGY